MIKKERKKQGIKQVVYIPDTHHPYHDKRAIKALENFVKEQEPDVVIFGGDNVDFYSISSFDKDPERIYGLQEELISAISFMSKIKKLAGKDTDLHFLEGNHEFRMAKYLMRHPELASLDALRVPELLRLGQMGISYTPYDKGLMIDGFLFKHGTRANMYAAKSEVELEGVSGMSGHVHRIMRHSKTDRHGSHTWHTTGHLSDPAQIEYMKQQTPNWQQGFGVVEFNKRNGTHEVYQPVIKDGKFMFQGKIYKPTRNNK